MATFDWNGKSYEVIEDDDWLLKETREVERWIGNSGMAEQGIVTRFAVIGAVSIARVEPEISITSWLDAQTNRALQPLIVAIQAEVAAEEKAKADQAAADAVLSPTPAGSEPSQLPASPSMSSSSSDGGSPLSYDITSTPAT